MMTLLRTYLNLLLLIPLLLGSTRATTLPFNETFENSDGGFTLTGVTSWKWGAPTSGPSLAHSGSKVWATNLIGNYGSNEAGVLTSPVYDLSAAAGKSILVRWWQYLVTESGYDFARVEVSKDSGGTWETILGPRSGNVSVSWSEQGVLLDESYAVNGFQIRYTLVSDDSNMAPGFYVDDLKLVAISLSNADALHPEENFETNDGGFVVGGDFSSWSLGTPTSGPGAAHSGVKAWGTNLAGLYNSNEASSLTSPSYDLHLASGKVIVASWWQFIETEEGFDSATVEASKDHGLTWSTPAEVTYSGAISPEGWIRAQVFLDDSYAVSGFKLRFALNADSSSSFAGIYIDDFSVRTSLDLVPTAPGVFLKSTPKNTTANFTLAQFASHYLDPAGDSLGDVIIDSLPAHGLLRNGSQAVLVGDTISAQNLNSLNFVPTTDYVGNDAFQWTSFNSFGASVSATVSIEVVEATGPVLITSQPVSQTVNPGSAVNFSVIATGAAPISYQWRKNLSNIPGQTSPTFTIASASELEEGGYDVVITNPSGPTPSDPITLSVNDPVDITSSPGATSVNEGADVTLTVTATGTPPLNYQWLKEGNPIPNAIAASLPILKATDADKGNYQCKVTNMVGTKTSTASTVSVQLLPIIVQQPKSKGIPLNGSTTFSVTANGPNLSYQWYKGDAEIPGATSASLPLSQIIAETAGFYWVKVTNSVGYVDSDRAELRIVTWKDLSGNFQALLSHDNSAAPSEPQYPGRITVTITTKGTMTGKIEHEGLTHAISGRFTPELTFTKTILRNQRAPLQVQLQLDSFLHLVVANVSYDLAPGTFASDAYLLRARYSDSDPQSGRFTMRLSADSSSLTAPEAPGYATLYVTKRGSVRVVGRVSDGTVFSGYSVIQDDGGFAWFAQLYGFRDKTRGGRTTFGGSIASRIVLDRSAGTAAITGVAEWKKPALPLSAVWPTGGTAYLPLDGSAFVTPAANTPALVLPLSYNVFSLSLNGSFAGSPLVRLLYYTATNKFLFVLANPEKIQLKLDQRFGGVTGSFFDASTQKTRQVRGTILQAQSIVSGFFLEDTDAGTFEILPAVQ